MPGALVVSEGRSVAASSFLSLDPADRLGARGSECVFVLVEPTLPVADADEVAEEIVDCLRRALARGRGQTPSAALLEAVEAANRWLHDLNAGRPDPRRVYLGLTCVLAREADLYIAQVAPSQILIAQEGELYAFPGLDSWHWRRADGTDRQPLGLYPEVEPELYHTCIEPGDLIVLCSTSLARVIDREPQDVFVQSDPDAALAHLDRLAHEYEVDDAYAAAIVVPVRSARPPRPELALFRRVGEMCAQLLPEETVERIRERARRVSREDEVDLDRAGVHTLEYPDEAAPEPERDDPALSGRGDTAELTVLPVPPIDAETEPVSAVETEARDLAGDDEYWRPEHAAPVEEEGAEDADTAGEGSRTLTGLLAGAILALSAAVVGVWQIAVHRDRSLGEPRDDGTLGLPRLQRYDDSMHLPDLTGVRRRLPRLPAGRRVAVVSVLLVAALAVALGYSVHTARVRARQQRVEQLLQAAVQARQEAGQQSNPAAAQAYLVAARARVQQAQASGLDQQRASQELAAIDAALDKALHVERLANLQVLGGVPAPAAGVTPRVFFGNGQVYVFTDALYRLDANGTSLVRLLAPGDQVGGAPVGALQGAAWGDGTPVAFDGSNAYVLDPTSGTWSRHALATLGAPYSGIASISGYSGNLYLLAPGSGQILKYAAGAFGQEPEDWTGGLAADDLRHATDMEIDGHIYVLLKDGRVLSFYRSALEKTIAPSGVTPAVEGAVALSEQPDRPYLYEADAHGRILRLTRDGKLVQQFMPAAGGPSLDHVRDIAVDDVTGTAYILTDQALLTVRLPGPPR